MEHQYDSSYVRSVMALLDRETVGTGWSPNQYLSAAKERRIRTMR